jgi:Fe-S-cluster-containing hydrogenase component 2
MQPIIGLIKPSTSAIRVRFDPYYREDVASVCYQCKKAHCMDVCTTSALFREDGIIKFNPFLCNGCNECVEACPFDLIWTTQDQKIVKCDFCANYSTQYCLESCPVDAITIARKKQRVS